MANYKLNYSGEKIDELLTKIDNLGTGTDTKSGTVKLSSATDSNSGVSDGVAATPKAVSQLKADMNTKANKTDVLSLEEIQASTDLSGKIASASALKTLSNSMGKIHVFSAGTNDTGHVTFLNVPISYRIPAIFVGNANGIPDFSYCALFLSGNANGNSINDSNRTISATDNGNKTANITIAPVGAWGFYRLVVFY